MVWSSACEPGSPAQVARARTTSPRTVSESSDIESSRTASSPTVPSRPRALHPVARSFFTTKKATRGANAAERLTSELSMSACVCLLSSSSTAAFTSAMSEEARARVDSAAAASMPRLRALRRCSETATRSGASPSETGASADSLRRASASSSCARRRSTSPLKPPRRLLTYDSMSARKLFSKSPLLGTSGTLLCRLGLSATGFEALRELLLRGGCSGVRRALMSLALRASRTAFRGRSRGHFGLWTPRRRGVKRLFSGPFSICDFQFSIYDVTPYEAAKEGAAINDSTNEIPTMPDSILIADDYDDNRELLRLMLETEGYRIREARNGHEALDAALAEVPAAALIDLSMPLLDGWGLLRALRADERTRS